MAKEIKKSKKLKDVCYDIRGPVLSEAEKLEKEGHKILKLHIGNPAPFDFNAPQKVLDGVISDLKNGQGYSDSKGIVQAREAILNYYNDKKISNIEIDDIYIGNGISELIVMAMQGLLDKNDEILIPMPEYPLWTAAVRLAGAKPVYYVCDEKQDWLPDINDIKKKISSKTKGLVIINPNNPTGAAYPVEILSQMVKIAIENGLIVFSDEIYDQILYDDATHSPTASLAKETLFVTFGGLSKNYYLAGFRAGWMVLSGNKKIAKDYIEGLNILSNMRLCSNVPAQFAIKPALSNNHEKLVILRKKLQRQRDLSCRLLKETPGISCVKPKGTFYIFPKINTKNFKIINDEKFVLDFLRKEKVLLAHGTGFSWPSPDHFRMIFLPPEDELKLFFKKFNNFLSQYKQDQ